MTTVELTGCSVAGCSFRSTIPRDGSEPRCRVHQRHLAPIDESPEAGAATPEPPVMDAAPVPAVDQAKAKTEEVLSVALALLRATDDILPVKATLEPSTPRRRAGGDGPSRPSLHGRIAAGFVTRFLLSMWGGPLWHELRDLHEFVLRMRGDPRWSRGLPDRAEALIRYGLHLRADAAELLAPTDGPNILPATALAFGDALIEPEPLGLTIRVWSARLPDDRLREGLGPAVQFWREVAADPTAHRAAVLASNLRPWDPDRRWRVERAFTATFCELPRRAGLPYIKLHFAGSDPPPAERIVDEYREVLERWQHRLWDGREERERMSAQTGVVLIRGWALYTLHSHVGLNLTDALNVWNDFTDEHRRDEARQNSISHASEDRKIADMAAERLRRMLTPHPKFPR